MMFNIYWYMLLYLQVWKYKILDSGKRNPARSQNSKLQNILRFVFHNTGILPRSSQRLKALTNKM